METRGLLKRIAAITMAALTIVTSSGMDVNLLTANANELTKQATENAVDENTNKALQKKDAKVGAQAKLSFSTNEALKRAVDDAGFNIDVKTNKVTSAAIKYNQSLLTLGKDFTATAKRTSYTKNGSKYNYVFTVTVTGKGDYTGTARKTGVTQISTIKPQKTTKKLKSAKKADIKTTVDAYTSGLTSYVVSSGTGKWTIDFSRDASRDDKAFITRGDDNGKTVYRVSYFSTDTPNPKVSYDGKELTEGNNKDYQVESDNGILTITSNSGFIYDHTGEDGIEGIKLRYTVIPSVSTYPAGTLNLEDSNGDLHQVNFNGSAIGIADDAFEYTGKPIDPQVRLKVTINGVLHDEQLKSTALSNTAISENKAKVNVTLPDYMNNETVEIRFSISEKSMKNHYSQDPSSTTGITVENVNDEEYTGVAHTPEPVVTDKDIDATKKLTKDADYLVDYKNNTDANVTPNGTAISGKSTPTIEITGKGNYKDTIDKSFNIKQKEITDSSSKDTDGVDISVNGTYNGGNSVTPNVNITYSPKGVNGDDHKQLVNTLKQGTDFTVESADNPDTTWEAGSDHSVRITFHGNYSGTITKSYTVTTGSISDKDAKIQLDGQNVASVTVDKDDSTKATAKGTGNGINTTFDPIKSEYPDFHVLVNGADLSKGSGFKIDSAPTPTKGTHSWPEANATIEDGKTTYGDWKWRVTLTGDGNYGGEVTVTFNVLPLDLNDSAISVSKATFDKDSNPDVELTYTSKQDKKTTATISAGSGDSANFTAKGPEKKNIKTGNNNDIVLTGEGNYTGTRTVKAGKGYDLSKDTSYNNGEITVTLYDPFTGDEVSNAKPMPYYGPDVHPQVVIAYQTDSKTTKYTSSFRSINAVDENETDEDTGYEKYHLTIVGTGELYGTVPDDQTEYEVKPQEIKNDNVFAAGKETDSKNTNVISFTYDTSDLTSFTNPQTVVSSLSGKIYMVSKETEKVTAKDSDGNSVTNTDSAYKWDRPTIRVAMVSGTDYTLTQKSGATYTLKGTGSRYIGSADIKLKANITNSSDYTLSPSSIADIEYDGKAHFPDVKLLGPDGNELTGKYTVTYKNLDDNTEVTENDLTSEKPENGVIANPTGEKTKKFVDETRKGYQITVSIDDNNESDLTGSKTLTYRIYRLDAKTAINAYFNMQKYRYAGKDTKNPYLGKNAQIKSSDGNTTVDYSKKEGAPELSVTHTENNNTNNLVYGTDYKVEIPDGTNFQEPGVKTVTIVGKGKYKGTVQASYTVYADFSEDLKKKDLFTVTGLGSDSADTLTNDNLVLYYNGSSWTMGDTKDGKPTSSAFSLGSISITTAGGRTLQPGIEFTVTAGDLTKEGKNSKITISANTSQAPGFEGSLTITPTIKVTRANLKWTDPVTGNDATEITVPYRKEGYNIGEGVLQLHNSVGVADLKNNTDKVTVKPESGDQTVNQKVTNVGTYTVTVHANDNEADSSVLTLHIYYDLSDAKVLKGSDELNGQSFTYTGKEPVSTGDISVTTSEGEPLKNTDYTIARERKTGTADTNSNQFINAGDIKVILKAVEGRSYFSGTEPEIIYTITPFNTSDNFTVECRKELTYNGAAQHPDSDDISVKDTSQDANKQKLTEGTDYTVSYEGNCTDAGTYTIIVTGIGNYAGLSNNKASFTIKPYDLKNLTDSSKPAKLTIANQLYAGGELIVPDKVTLNDTTNNINLELKNPDDFSIDGHGDNKETGSGAWVTIKGNNDGSENGTGNYTGTSGKISFTIEKLNLSTITVSDYVLRDATYTGKAISPIDDYIEINIPVTSKKSYIRLQSVSTTNHPADYTLRFTRTKNGSGETVSGETPVIGAPTEAGTYKVEIIPLSTSKYVQTGNGTTKTIQGDENGFHVLPLDISSIKGQFLVDNAEWTGRPVTPKVYLNGVAIKDMDTAYNVTYEKNVDACGKDINEMRGFNPQFKDTDLPTAVIEGKENYTGTLRLHFQIGQPFNRADVKTPTIKYDGAEHKLQKSDLTITYPDKNVDMSRAVYEITWPSEDYTQAGTKRIVLTAISGGPLYGNKGVNYEILKASGVNWTAEFTSLTRMDSSGMYTVDYQGAAITPEVKGYILGNNGSRQDMYLTESEITYSNNNAAGTATVTVKPKNYEGTKTLYFKILGADLTDDTKFSIGFTDGLTRRKYTGSAITPKISVIFFGEQGTVTLTQDRDYAITYENNTKAGPAKATVTGIGNYQGAKELDFSIYANLNDTTSTFTIPKQMYTGQPITELAGATLKAGGNDLKLGTDYTLSITSTDSFRTKGTAIFTAQGKYYEGTRTVQFEIGNDASMYNILGVASTYVYDRQAHKPVPVVTDKQGTVYSVDSVTYASTSDGDTCINAGNVKMQIVITSHGQSVTIPYNYTIEPKNINTASITPIADVDYNGKAHTPTIRITDGTNLLTGSPTSWDGTADFVYTYYNNVQPGTATVSIQGINNYTGVANVYFAINVKAAPQMIVTAMPSGRLKVTWKKVSGVSGYRIFYSSANGTQKQTTLSSSKKSTYITGLTRGVVYTVGLQSFITANGQNGYSTASVQQIATSTSKPKITSAKSTGKGKIKITWKKVSNATAYMVYRKTAGSSKWVRVKTTKSTSFTNTGLKSGKKYTYKVISYKQSGVKRSFSKYSTGKTVKAR